jgi:hypothetical protein
LMGRFVLRTALFAVEGLRDPAAFLGRRVFLSESTR